MILINKNNNNKSALKNLALISQVGISVITPILLGVYIGQWIDKWVGTNGLFMIIFILLGTGGGFLNLFKITGVFKDKRK
ncbi:AtpZ/AtpI family protein [Tissierella creatinophila]|uniref:Putative F0F1-ATPase subunit n=1 Tax=Tissierella creatinophila DSM 6911 TaxID=1123403 RepID=A0A1U7M3F1_TISCR|nr:AtpZ/AtpI family protein [Tissierella creatinophila]OLS01821.1 putative F0F1-ATPase subunit [Tissierella creatinophila DSM 6911]